MDILQNILAEYHSFKHLTNEKGYSVLNLISLIKHWVDLFNQIQKCVKMHEIEMFLFKVLLSEISLET